MHFPLPQRTCDQGSLCPTFKAPSPDTVRTVAEACDWHHVHSKSHPFLVCADDAMKSTITVNWGEATQGIYRIANAVIKAVMGLRPKTEVTARGPIVGLCSSADPLTYLLSMLGILRAGYPVLLLSHRASSDTLQHLISISGASLILSNGEDKELLSKITRAATSLDIESVVVSNHLSWPAIFPNDGTVPSIPAISEYDMEQPSIILHSSGSTTLPRLNIYTHNMVETAFWQPWYGYENICGAIMCTAGVPMAGASGVMQALFAASSGLVISGFLPKASSTQLNPNNVWKAMVLTKSDYAFVFQPFLYIWCEDEEKLKLLTRMKGILFGGSALKQDVGDRLAQNGARIISLYGSSEGGLLSRVFPENPGLDWEWVAFYPLVNPAFKKQSEQDDALYELILKKGDYHQPTQFNAEFEGVPAFATGDLLQPHPTKQGLWKYICRVDDQVTIGTVYKINALAFERILMSDPLVRSAVIFSHGLIFGVIIDPDPQYVINKNMTDASEVEKFKGLITPIITQYNSLAPDGAKLLNVNIIVTSPDKPFVYGEKGLPRRKAAVNAYHAEVALVKPL